MKRRLHESGSRPRTQNGHVHFKRGGEVSTLALDTHQRHHFWMAIFTTAILTAVITASTFHMMGGNAITGPAWDPAGNTPFRTWVREVQAWLNVTSSRLNPSQQAAALQLGLRRVAREFAFTIPPAAIHFVAVTEGTPADPVAGRGQRLVCRTPGEQPPSAAHTRMTK